MFLGEIDGEADLSIYNISILPSDQCATEDQRVRLSVYLFVYSDTKKSNQLLKKKKRKLNYAINL